MMRFNSYYGGIVMDIVEFINSHNEIIESRIIDNNSIYDSIAFPKDTVGFTYYHNGDEECSTYIVGELLKKLDVVKIANEQLYDQFIEYGKKNDGAKYLIGVLNGQIYFLCTSFETMVVSNYSELQNCLYHLLYEKNLKTKK